MSAIGPIWADWLEAKNTALESHLEAITAILDDMGDMGFDLEADRARFKIIKKII